MDEETKRLLVVYGALKAARAALDTVSHEAAREHVAVDGIVEDMRKLAATIAKRVGL